jgi:hypothetical protein
MTFFPGAQLMKEAKFFRKQAEKAERLAQETADEEAALSLSNLAKAYRRSQADVLKKNKRHSGRS